jgi:hypothetical protein
MLGGSNDFVGHKHKWVGRGRYRNNGGAVSDDGGWGASVGHGRSGDGGHPGTPRRCIGTPAGLARGLKVRRPRSCTRRRAGTKFLDYAAYGRGNGTSAWGVGLQYFSAGDVDQTDLTGNNTGS